MAAVQANKASWLTWLVAGLAATVRAQSSSSSSSSSTRSSTRSSYQPFWTATIRVMESTSTYGYTYTRSTGTSTDLYRTTVMRTIKSTVTPSVTPTSTSTGSGGIYYNSYDNDVKQIIAFYSNGAVAESDLEPTYGRIGFSTSTSTSSTSYVYIMPVTWIAPSSCSSTSFSLKDTITPTIPTIVRDQIKPTSKATTTRSAYYGTTTYVVETWYLSESAAPSTSDYSYRSYVAQCTAPPVSGLRSGGGSSDSDSDITWCSWYGACTGLKVWIIIIASVLPGLFVLGFLESYFWFRRLMIGKGALRFGTICWIMLSLWMVCFTRSQSQRSAEDQKLLRENWNKTTTGQALKLWFKWGFRHRYPVPLLGQYSRNTVGIVPEGQPLPQMGQTNVAMPGFQPQPGAPGAPGAPAAPSIIYHNGQPYYSGVPPGWVAMPNGAEGQPMPPPGTAYMPPQPYTEAYAPQAKDPSTVSVSPVQQPVAPNSVPSTGPTPPPPSELHSASGALPAPQDPPREDPPSAPKPS